MPAIHAASGKIITSGLLVSSRWVKKAGKAQFGRAESVRANPNRRHHECDFSNHGQRIEKLVDVTRIYSMWSWRQNWTGWKARTYEDGGVIAATCLHGTSSFGMWQTLVVSFTTWLPATKLIGHSMKRWSLPTVRLKRISPHPQYL